MANSTILKFGDFTEKERLLYFSEESLKSSTIEFPEDFLSYDFGEGNLVAVHGSSVEEIVGENIRESGNTEVDKSFQNEALTSSRKENGEEDFRDDAINQVSAKSELVTVSERNDSDLPDNNTSNGLTGELPAQNEDKPNIEKLEMDFKLSSVGEGENNTPPELVQQKPSLAKSTSSDDASPTNVVTVGTKTMMTTSTRTVESSHEIVKSSWADLFKTKPSSKPQGPLPTSPAFPKQLDGEMGDNVGPEKDQFRHYFLDVLKKIELSNQVPHLQPRGLKNNANWCYINATLQVLIYCPSFYHFLMKFRLKTDRGTSSTPILDALVLFASQFSKMAPRPAGGKSQEWGRQEVMMGMPFEPTYVYNLLTMVKTTLSQQGKQEDAEEFLSCILNGLHEEMVLLENPESKQDAEGSTNHVGTECKIREGLGEWEQVGPRNKSTVTRKSTMAKSPVAEMFGGYLRSSLVQHGMKESASIQPFFSIQLDLRGEVTTVQQAFDNFFRVEEVEGFQCDKSKTEVEVSKKWTLDSLPVVMILHLKRFVVNKNGCEKLTKKITYDSQLHVPSDTLSKVLKIRNKNLLSYKLFAITYHHGKNLHGGHYTSDIFHPAIGWFRADDLHVKTIPAKFVFNPLSNRDPYLLYYHRGDISV